MKQLHFFLYSIFLLFLILFFSNCLTVIEEKPLKNYLWAANFLTNYYEKVPAEKKYEGQKCIIFIANDMESKFTPQDYQEIANEYDQTIYPEITSVFGTMPDEDQNGKVVIFLLDIQDGYNGDGYVAGYFDYTHEFTTSPCSNEMDMLFIDCQQGIPKDPIFYATIAHEFQHMINFNQKMFVQHSTNQDTWINEGLSSAAETLYCNGLIDQKISDFNTNNFIQHGQYFISWTNEKDAKALYSSVYVFFQWLRIHADNNTVNPFDGDGIFKAITDSSYSDYKAVESAIRNYISDYANSGVWKTYIRDWFIANLFQQPTGIYGYLNKFSALTIRTISNATVDLYPGGAVYSTISTAPTLSPSGDVDFVGLYTGTKQIDDIGPVYSGNYLLTYNFSGDADKESTIITGLPTSLISYSSVDNRGIAPSDPYPLDHVILQKNNFKIKQ